MTTRDTQEKREEIGDQTGSLADSARRHLAYQALSQQIALSEAALRRILEAVGERELLVAPKSRNTDGK